MPKNWEEMTEAEKIEDLRKDVKTIFQHLNSITESQRQITHRLDQIGSLANEVYKKVERLGP
jgi:Ni,Fe-hydrogenase III large subunit